jgi:hypothetical protein
MQLKTTKKANLRVGFFVYILRNMKEALINASFRAKRSVDPESTALNSMGRWIPAFAGMTPKELISGS